MPDVWPGTRPVAPRRSEKPPREAVPVEAGQSLHLWVHIPWEAPSPKRPKPLSEKQGGDYPGGGGGESLPTSDHLGQGRDWEQVPVAKEVAHTLPEEGNSREAQGLAELAKHPGPQGTGSHLEWSFRK